MTNKNFKKRVLVIGVPDMAYIGLDTLNTAGVNIVGVLGPLKTHNTYEEFKSFVESKKLNFINYESLNSEELHKTISDLSVDIGVVFSFNSKFPPEFINLFKDGILNLHPSLLPEYRGGNPYSRVIMNGEQETGVTIHFISENFDEGDIVAQVKCPIDERETIGTIFNKTNYIGVRLMLNVLFEYEKNGALNRIPQPQGEYKKAKNLANNEYYIDFNKSAIDIERQIRALNPFFNCYTYYKGQVLKIFKASVLNHGYENAQNGEIVKIEADKFFIKTQDGILAPEVLQFGMLFTGDAEDFIKLTKPTEGEIIGR